MHYPLYLDKIYPLYVKKKEDKYFGDYDFTLASSHQESELPCYV
jgi:hypothetical protein